MNKPQTDELLKGLKLLREAWEVLNPLQMTLCTNFREHELAGNYKPRAEFHAVTKSLLSTGAGIESIENLFRST